MDKTPQTRKRQIMYRLAPFITIDLKQKAANSLSTRPSLPGPEPRADLASAGDDALVCLLLLLHEVLHFRGLSPHFQGSEAHFREGVR